MKKFERLANCVLARTLVELKPFYFSAVYILSCCWGLRGTFQSRQSSRLKWVKAIIRGLAWRLVVLLLAVIGPTKI